MLNLKQKASVIAYKIGNASTSWNCCNCFDANENFKGPDILGPAYGKFHGIIKFNVRNPKEYSILSLRRVLYVLSNIPGTEDTIGTLTADHYRGHNRDSGLNFINPNRAFGVLNGRPFIKDLIFLVLELQLTPYGLRNMWKEKIKQVHK